MIKAEKIFPFQSNEDGVSYNLISKDIASVYQVNLNKGKSIPGFYRKEGIQHVYVQKGELKITVLNIETSQKFEFVAEQSFLIKAPKGIALKLYAVKDSILIMGSSFCLVKIKKTS